MAGNRSSSQILVLDRGISSRDQFHFTASVKAGVDGSRDDVVKSASSLKRKAWSWLSNDDSKRIVFCPRGPDRAPSYLERQIHRLDRTRVSTPPGRQKERICMIQSPNGSVRSEPIHRSIRLAKNRYWNSPPLHQPKTVTLRRVVIMEPSSRNT